MKLLFCQDCGDIIAPYHEARRPRWCGCERHAVWWENPRTGILRVFDRYWGHNGSPREPRAYVLGLTNLLLSLDGSMSASVVEALIDAHDDSYLFKRWRSLVIRFRPGESSDTAWQEELPK